MTSTDAIIKEGNILEFKALVMSKSILHQLPILKPYETMPELIGWVSEPGEWYIAKHEGRLVKISRSDMWVCFSNQLRGRDLNYVQVSGLLDERRDKLPQIFVR